jgi:hypothetical protein
MANAYEEVRLEGSKICDRKKLEAYWGRQDGMVR